MTEKTIFDGMTQWRISRLQVYNWGTFSGYHDVAVSAKGFLLTGASGSGKSTLLDAMVTLLFPKPDYNAAAREGESGRGDRSLMTYIRGAWSTQAETDPETGRTQSVVRHLREGSTFSAIALTLHDALGDERTLMLVAYVKGRAREEGAVNRQYLILRGNYGFNLADFRAFADSDFNFRGLKARLPEPQNFTTFLAYSERFCEIFGIRDRTALKLLGKAQSAKNLGDLNTFLRTFMLDEPKTFAVAETLVSEFGELSRAHRLVVEAREEESVLKEARAAWERVQEERRLAAEREEELAAYGWWSETLERDACEQALGPARARETAADAALAAAQTAHAAQENEVNELERLRYARGGQAIENLRTKLEHTRGRLKSALKLRNELAPEFERSGRPFPDSADAWSAAAGEMRTLLERRDDEDRRRTRERDEAAALLNTSEKAFEHASKEVRAMKMRPSNIPSDLLELRSRIAEAAGVDEKALPFAGELLEVKKSEARWQGAIERVLRGFALSMLVPEEHYMAVARTVDETVLDARLVYLRVLDAERTLEEPAYAGDDMLPEKLEAARGPLRAWLVRELAERFDYRCVESIEDFAAAEKAVTPTGQVKTSGKRSQRHEKDDRRTINDRRYWVTGFSNAEKLALYEAEAQRLAAETARLRSLKNALDDEMRAAAEQAATARRIVNTLWEEVDAAGIGASAKALEEQLNALLAAEGPLKDIEARLAAAKTRLSAALDALVSRRSELDAAGAVRKSLEARLERHNRALRTMEEREGRPEAIVILRLDAKLAANGGELTLEKFPEICDAVKDRLQEERALGAELRARAEGDVVAKFEVFRTRFPARSDHLDATLASAPGFFELLEEIERDGLPKHEAKFRELLENQSLQNFTELSTQLRDARRRIMDRMLTVNASLAGVAFSRLEDSDSHLRIDVSDRRLDAVDEFQRDMKTILSGAWAETTPESAEERFRLIERIVTKLSSAEPQFVRWRDLVLDVRNHVEFTAVEFDDEGRVIEAYLSGAGKSGGQRQKLTTTCLAAALRYQLGSSASGLPAFGPVLLDEAFDKADSEFTDISMNIFRQFGFQMIVATPEKSVSTLEPYIGGACLVLIEDRRRSGVVGVAYDAANGVLDWSKTGPAGETGLSRRELLRREMQEALLEVERARARPRRVPKKKTTQTAPEAEAPALF